MIVIKSPRYRDRTVLLARHRLPCGQDVTVKITEAARQKKCNQSNITRAILRGGKAGGLRWAYDFGGEE